MTTPFPQTMDYAGFNAPSRIECDIYDLVVEGEIPAEIEGTWFRSIPDPQYPPRLGHDTFLSGDGMISAFRIAGGHADFEMRYVQTERWKNERKARRGLYGLYRNPYTDDPSVQGQPGRSAANTTPVWHAGKLLCTKEDGRPIEVDPTTLATRGEYDFGGKLRSETVTAHVRIDPDTGEMFFFGYEAGGLASRDIAFCVADKDGRLVSEEWFEAPFVSMVHDFAVTKEHIIFPLFPTTADLERIKAGGVHWVHEMDRETMVGIMPRGGSVKDMRWFRGPSRSAYHFMNAFTEGAKVHLDFTPGKVNPFPFIQEASGLTVTPEDMMAPFCRWTFDMAGNDDHYQERPLGPGGDMPAIADRDAMKDYEIGYYQTFDPRSGPPLIVGPVGPGFNTLLRINVKTGEVKALNLGPGTTLQEHIHIPSKQPGHEGYLAFVVDLHDQNLTDAVIVEAANIEKGPIARIKMPLRLRCQVHGTWVAATELPIAAAA